MSGLLEVGTPARIVVLRALFLGDLLCAAPALAALGRRFPGAEVSLVGLPWAAELVGRLPGVDRLIAFPGYPGLPEVPVDPATTERWLGEMRAERFDLAVQMHGSGGVTNDLVAALGARVSVGFGPEGDGRLTATLPWREDEHEVRRWLRLVGLLGVEGDPAAIDVSVTDADEAAADALMAELPPGDGPVVCLHAGAKDAPRRWPAERFAALADELVVRHGARVVLTGATGERPLVEAVLARASVPCLDLAGRTDLGTLLALVRRLDLLVTNDTGTSHVAAAVRTPSVVLFGPTRPARWAPLDQALHRVVDAAALRPDLPPGSALGELPVAAVLAACGEMLAGPAARRPTADRLLEPA